MSNPNKEAKKKLRNARIAFFVIPNAILVIICAILGYAKWQELKSHWPLFAISGIIILLVLNRICYSLYKTREDQDLTKLESEGGAKQVDSSIKLLRYAAAALAFISFITTAQGLQSFVFTEAWQAYTASFAVQSILLIFNFLFFPLYVRIKNPRIFPAFFQHILTCCIVFLFIGSLIVSSTFSFVFIANNTYKDMRAKNSNITIDKFLIEEAYKLSDVNDYIGEDCREIVSDVSILNKIVKKQKETTEDANYNGIKEVIVLELLSNSNETSNSEPANTPSFDVSLQTYKDAYETIYQEHYLPVHGLYEELVKDSVQKEMLKKINYNYLSTLINSIDKPDSNDDVTYRISQYMYVLRVEIATDAALSALANFANLSTKLGKLKAFFEKLLPYYEKIDNSSLDLTENERNIQAILSFVYNNEYVDSDAKGILSFLSELREGMLTPNAAEAGQPSSTSQPDSTSESDNPHKELHEFTEAFNSFVKYAELKERIKGFINNNLSITYYIKSEGEPDASASDAQSLAAVPPTPAPSADGESPHKTVSEAEWTQIRKQDFVEFISCLKGLPDLEPYKTEADASELIKNYDQQAVLEEAYTLNRDLLEDISGFEKAINYFKYDFKLMAVLSAIMALFMDGASFLAGGFMFGAGFFKNAKNKKRKRIIKGSVKKIGIFKRTT